MNILLTGGSGFIGRNLNESLEEKYRIFAPSHKMLELTDEQVVRKYIIKNKIRIVIHTAVKNGDGELENILKMFFSIYNSLDLLDKFINFGSGAEYEKARDLRKVKEADLGKFIPQDSYGLGKLICSKVSENNKKIITLLPFGVFGKYENYRKKFISNAIIKNLFGLPIKIKQDVLFDYLYVEDLSSIVEFLINQKNIFGNFNVCPTQSITISKIAEVINEVAVKPSKIIFKNKKQNFQYTGSNYKLRKTIPYLRFTTYKKSIKSLYHYYESHINELDRKAIFEDNYYKISKIRS